MIEVKTFDECLHSYLEKFDDLASRYDHTTASCSELENLLDDYSQFITNEQNQTAWEQCAMDKSSERNQVVLELRRKSAYCVAIIEKYRALKLLNGNDEISGYFQYIESCIQKEFGSFHVDADSKVLLIGSGSYPMTPLLIAQQTGAAVVGTDIDDEAIELGKQVVDKLGNGLNIKLEQTFVEDLPFTKQATHIIFSSTVEIKYDILERLHALTNDNVVVVMRYGDRLKSLFNYPKQEANAQKWKLVETVLRPDHVFDVALYKKVSEKGRVDACV